MGVIDRDERVVCVTTGHLLKDPETVVKMCDKPVEIDATKEAIRKPWAGSWFSRGSRGDFSTKRPPWVSDRHNSAESETS